MKLQQNGHSDREDLKIAHRYVDMDKAAQFNIWEYISRIFFTVQYAYLPAKNRSKYYSTAKALIFCTYKSTKSLLSIKENQKI